MSTRTSSAAAIALLLAACGRGEGSSHGSTPSARSNAAESGNASIGCAIAGQALAEDCTLEHVRVEGAPYLVIRHPDGGFRRFAIKDGTLGAADGSQQATVTRSGDQLEVLVGSDRYHLANKQISDDK